ncbi:cbb3-type cytochrome c oxidase subunit I [Cloacibacterium sp.]|uniref:cbb3-type cytochrome c oxidase subunit I n=1 Tax=Cloacibacterium sp. TaxID=1913682 RepID=UPI0039E2F736
MKKNNYPFYYIAIGLISLGLCLLVGLLSGFQYIIPEFIKGILPFTALRPLHTLYALSWIFLGAIGGIYWYVQHDENAKKTNPWIMKFQFWIFILMGILITICYILRKFEGKEYLEYPHIFYFPILVGWVLFALFYFKSLFSSLSQWPAYYWMWGTGCLFMIFHFTEAHLWILPYFRENYLQNLTMQWKAGGSYVGAWNMLIYGSSMYVMSKTSGNSKYCHSKTAFFFFFLSLVNSMFNWAHHVYPVPNASWIRYAAYAISMTEWIILIRMIYMWKQNLSQEKKKEFTISYKVMMLADLWIFLNLFLALLISIPAINLLTHGTHITVAHSMGTTIGINTLILLSSVIYIFEETKKFTPQTVAFLKMGINIFNISFVGFWVILIIMGIEKSKWMYFTENVLFSTFQDSMHAIYIIFTIFGLGLLIGLYMVIFKLLKIIKSIVCSK